MEIFSISLLGITISPTWYGLMYALWFLICYQYVKHTQMIKNEHMDTLLLYVFLGVILGGRLWYVLFYNLAYFLDHPMKILATWEGGMSFHGGAIGVICSLFLFAWRYHYPIFRVSDPVVTILPVALGLGRIGNYINGELPGFSPYTGPFPMMIGWIAHFPSPLLQAFLEGLVLLSILLGVSLWQQQRGNIPGLLSGLFLGAYGIMRIGTEFFRLPDAHIGYLLGTHWLTLGMIYSLPMIIGAIIIFILIRKSYWISARIWPGSR